MRKIFFYVFTIHLCVVAFALLFVSQKKETKKPLQIKAVTIKPKSADPEKKIDAPISISSSQPIPTKKSETPLKPKPVPIKKQEAPSPKSSDKSLVEQKKTKPQTKASAAAIPMHLLKELEESLNKIEQKSDNAFPKATLALPKTINSLQVEQINSPASLNSSTHLDYESVLINCLHQALKLPEYGIVKIKLTLRQTGEVVDLIVLKADSQKNKSYLEKQIRNVKFPNLCGSNFLKKQEYSFILTFCNEM